MRFFPDAQTIRFPPAARLMLGNAHFVGSFFSSVRKWPARLIAAPVGLRTSIQSDASPSSSSSVASLSAMNSEITKCVAGFTISTDTFDDAEPNALDTVSV